MNDTKTFIDDFLQHYKSEFYDPVKAHEYYEKNKKLKGRKKLNKKQEAAWEFAKGNIDKAKTKELHTAGENNAKAMIMLRENAAKKREDISKKLAALFKSIGDDRNKKAEALAKQHGARLEDAAKAVKAKLEKISEAATAKIEGLPPIPDGISKAERAKLTAERSKDIAKIRGEAFTERKGVTDAYSKQRKELSDALSKQKEHISEGINKDKEQARAGSDTSRAAVATELKAGIDKARSSYQTLKENLKAKYDKKSDQEREAISRERKF